jgi:hypothetical protein
MTSSSITTFGAFGSWLQAPAPSVPVSAGEPVSTADDESVDASEPAVGEDDDEHAAIASSAIVFPFPPNLIASPPPACRTAHGTGCAKRCHFPHAEMHRLDSGHFAVEDCLPYVVEPMTAFYDRIDVTLAPARAQKAAEARA